jgi:hypothetical protein
MKNRLFNTSKILPTSIASLSLFVGLPINANANENTTVKKVKVKDHKVKVKTIGGKAKIKNLPPGAAPLQLAQVAAGRSDFDATMSFFG